MRRREALGALAAAALWLGLWQLGATLVNPSLLLKIPLPGETFRAFLRLWGEEGFRRGVGSSVLHILLGFLAAAALGTAGGLASAACPWFRRLFTPPLRLIRTVPVAAFVMLAWLWIPSRLLPACIAGMMVLPILWSHVEAGALGVDEQLPEMARVMGMGPLGVLTRVRLPLMAPALRTGCLTAVGIAWKAGVAAEVICNPSGSIGALLQGAKAAVDYQRVFAVTLAVVLLSLAFENLLKLAWKEQRR